MAKHFIQDAIKRPGAMTAAAKTEGVSNNQYVSEHQHDSGHSGQMARFAKVLRGLNKGK